MMRIPEEIVQEVAIPYEGVRDAQGILFDLKVELPPNVDTAQLLRRLAPLLKDD